MERTSAALYKELFSIQLLSALPGYPSLYSLLCRTAQWAWLPQKHSTAAWTTGSTWLPSEPCLLIWSYITLVWCLISFTSSCFSEFTVFIFVHENVFFRRITQSTALTWEPPAKCVGSDWGIRALGIGVAPVIASYGLAPCLSLCDVTVMGASPWLIRLS